MDNPLVIRHDKNILHKWAGKWFGANRGTHWTIAGSVAVIILGGYVIYNNRDSNPANGSAIPTAERTPVPTVSTPLTLEK
jgi:hypothetical protein